VHELRGPRVVPFARRDGRWELRFDRPAVDRLEYLLELGGERVPDPENPRRAPGAFGEKSVVEFPGYVPPAWVADDAAPEGSLRELPLESRALRATTPALLWTAAGSDPEQPLPLLLVHDGPEYARYSQLLRLLDHLVARGETPPLRAALLPPPLDRSETYSASARYARALAEEWLPALAHAAPLAGRPVGLGASLGALALLHAHWVRPGVFGGLLLQSGSFFRRRFDAHESSAHRYARITRFVSTVAGGGHAEPLPVTVTCGTGEENLDNNRFLAAALGRRGFGVRLVEHADAHNWISWRDVLHPQLAELLSRSLR
jgi:enterochelin esterase-like enzyme